MSEKRFTAWLPRFDAAIFGIRSMIQCANNAVWWECMHSIMIWCAFFSNSHSRKWKNKSAQTKWQWNVPQTTAKLAQFCANGICLTKFWRDFRRMFSLSVRSFSISISSKNFRAFSHQLPLCWWEFLLSKHKLHAISLTTLFCSGKRMGSSETKKNMWSKKPNKTQNICLIACWMLYSYRNSFVWNKRKDAGRCPYQVWNLTFLLFYWQAPFGLSELGRLATTIYPVAMGITDSTVEMNEAIAMKLVAKNF